MNVKHLDSKGEVTHSILSDEELSRIPQKTWWQTLIKPIPAPEFSKLKRKQKHEKNITVSR